MHASDARGPLRPLPRDELALESILDVIVLPTSSQPLNMEARTCELKCGVMQGCGAKGRLWLHVGSERPATTNGNKLDGCFDRPSKWCDHLGRLQLSKFSINTIQARLEIQSLQVQADSFGLSKPFFEVVTDQAPSGNTAGCVLNQRSLYS